MEQVRALQGVWGVGSWQKMSDDSMSEKDNVVGFKIDGCPIIGDNQNHIWTQPYFFPPEVG